MLAVLTLPLEPIAIANRVPPPPQQALMALPLRAVSGRLTLVVLLSYRILLMLLIPPTPLPHPSVRVTEIPGITM